MKNEAWRTVEAYIPMGEENAITQAKLAFELHITPAQAKQLITEARPQAEEEGTIIASSSHGYYFPASVGELRHYRDMMHSQAISRLHTIKTVDRMLKEFSEDGTKTEKAR